MGYFKILVAGVLCLFSLYGCRFIIIPIPTGLIMRAIEGPQYCVDQYKRVGDRMRTPKFKWATITKIHGESSRCKNKDNPILVNITFDEEKQLERQPKTGDGLGGTYGSHETSTPEKIGFFDIQEVIAKSNEGKKAEEQFKEFVEKDRAATQEKEKELRQLKEEIEKTRAYLKEDVLRARESDYQKQFRDYQLKIMNANEELKKKQKAIIGKLLPQIMKVVEKIKEHENYTSILEKNEQGVSGYSTDKDITIKVIENFNKGTTENNELKKDFSVQDDTRLDSRFIAYDNGTVLDTRTYLMWAAKDNGSDINWANAKSYSENYRGGGYTDWRMPTHAELAGLYDAGKSYKSDCGSDAHLTELIQLTCSWVWASETRGSKAAYFYFYSGKQDWIHQSGFFKVYRTLPVRSVKKTI